MILTICKIEKWKRFIETSCKQVMSKYIIMLFELSCMASDSYTFINGGCIKKVLKNWENL